MDTGLVRVPQPNLSGAAGDAEFVRLWLDGYTSPHTRRNYARYAYGLLDYTGKPLHALTLADLQGYLGSLGHLAPTSLRFAAMAVKSLFSFAQRTGYLRINVATALKAPKGEAPLSERILTEGEVLAMIRSTYRLRDAVILRLLYATGLRVSELVSLRWENVRPADGGGAILAIRGKGGKMRYVRIPEKLYQALLALKSGSVEGYIFTSQMRRPLTDRQVRNIVERAALRAGLERIPSPHWLRHCAATHALRRGMPVADVAGALGHSSVAITSRYLHASPSAMLANYLPDA